MYPSHAWVLYFYKWADLFKKFSWMMSWCMYPLAPCIFHSTLWLQGIPTLIHIGLLHCLNCSSECANPLDWTAGWGLGDLSHYSGIFLLGLGSGPYILMGSRVPLELAHTQGCCCHGVYTVYSIKHVRRAAHLAAITAVWIPLYSN